MKIGGYSLFTAKYLQSLLVICKNGVRVWDFPFIAELAPYNVPLLCMWNYATL
jgi:hypothetical protein